ncbi:MAG TPA: hypothetical protein PKY95_09010, partial [candidate division Zixibacteria bacterium]|nr:hypothetical protein [candidate division Zixibacteria bacterium]
MDVQYPDINLRYMLPEMFLFLWACVVIAYDAASRRRSETGAGYLALFGLVVTGLLLAFTGDGAGWGRMFVQDTAARFFKMVFLGAAFMAIGSSFGIMRQRITHHRGEFFGLILLST